MAKSLVLAFRTKDSKICNIRINDPKADLTRTQIEAVMNELIGKNVFQTGTGAALASIDSVYTVVTNKNEVLM